MSIAQVAAFHDYESLTRQLQHLTQVSNGLATLSSIGKTMEGRDIWCVQVADCSTDPQVEHRPGFLATANLHGVEMAGSCQLLHFLGYLIEQHPGNARIQQLLREHVIYVIPRLAYDASDYMIRTGRRVRSRLVDIREPNTIYPKDLTGDGLLLRMRWQSETGDYRLSRKDPRVLVPRTPNDREGPFYHLADEGLIHEWDGGPVRMARARVDFNRNFPSMKWRPMPEMVGQGRYPLSEPETRALADFVLSHLNIVGTADFHTGNPAVFYPSSAHFQQPRHPQDRDLIRQIGKRAEAITGWPLVISYTEISEGLVQSDMPGAYKDWLYERMGLPAYTLEMGMFYNYLGFGPEHLTMPSAQHAEQTGLKLMEAHDKDPSLGLFYDWQPFDHPQLGAVEIGGWHTVPWSNPPLSEMEGVCEKGTQFLIEYAAYAPRLTLESIQVQRVADELCRIRARVVNVGNMDTNLTQQALEVYPDAVPRVMLQGDYDCVAGKRTFCIDHLKAGGGWQDLEWVVQPQAAHLTLQVSTLRGAFVQAGLKMPVIEQVPVSN